MLYLYKKVGGTMILIDKNIKQRIDNNELIIEGYNPDNLNGISYDLTIDYICSKQSENPTVYEIAPGDVVFIKTIEKFNIPHDILGRIAEKNSRMRQGLRVDGPHYQPGHATYAYLRVQNISDKIIELSKGMKIAQIIFEQLNGIPDKPYDMQSSNSFQNEDTFVGLGNYKKEYEKQIKKRIEKESENIEDVSHRIYANVLTLMGVMVAIFALLTINFQAFSNTDLNTHYIIIMNLSMALCIVLMLGIVIIFVNKAKNRWFLAIYLLVLAALAIATFVTSCVF